MANQKRKTFHHGNLREALLEASLKLLDEMGPEGVTIRAVARETGVSHAAPVNHFKDREALLTGLSIQLFEELSDGIQRKLRKVDDKPADVVAVFADGLIDYGLKHPNRYRLLWRRDLVDNEDEGLQQAMDGIYDQLIDEISKSRKKKPFDQHTVAIALWSIAHGYVSMRLDGNFEEMKDTVSGKKRKDAIIELLMQSLKL